MTPELHQQVRRLFDAASELPPARRSEFLAAQTATPEVLAEVRRLLDASAAAQSFLRTAPGQTLQVGRYLIEKELGRGGMGIVYQAADPALNRKIALKLIRSGFPLADDDQFHRDALLREARAAGPLRHPGIVTVYDVGEADGVPFIAMELIDGPSLFAVLAQTPRLDPPRAIDILRQVASALDYAHSQGIVHRDIKPANILLEAGSRARITDFGIAKIASGNASTLGLMQIGTAHYMSPEQIQTLPLDGRSDQFALAAMAYEMLTGSLAFNGETATSISYKIVHEPRPSAHAANAGLPAAVDPVLARALAKLASDRYATCSDFVTALHATLLPPEPPTRPSQMPIALPPVSSRPSRSGAVVVGVIVLACIGFLIFRFRPAAPAPAPKAEPPVAKTIPAPAPIPAPPVEKPAAAQPGVVAVNPPPKKTAPPPRTEEPAPIPEPNETPQERAAQLYRDAMADLRAGRAAKAASGFRDAAELGDARSMNELGNLYRAGNGIPRDSAEALRWFTKAAEAGNSSAMVFLGSMYASGDGVLKRPAEAIRWFTKAAEGGNPVAMDALGQMYWNGNGVAQDDRQAVDWFQKAAAKANAAALYDLGLAYETGRGIKADPAAARNLFRQAAAAGDRRAKSKSEPRP